MSYSNGRWNDTGRFSAPTSKQAEQNVHQADEAAAAARDEHSPERIREEYAIATAKTTQKVGVVYGQGLTDRQAFDQAISDHGYINAVKALKTVSAQAKARDDAYWAKRGRR
jgi:hypothetical protein